MHGEDDAVALEALRAGEPEALDTLYARWSPLVYSLALRCLDDVGTAEEVTRAVFAEVWESRHTVDPTRSEFSGWLVGLTRSSLAAAEAAPATGGADRSSDAVEQSPEVESKTDVLAERVVLAAEMSRLDAVPQRVLRMVLDDGLSHVEVAQRTGLPVEEVRRHIASSLIELRQRREVGADAQ